jgi:hypothetical protein
MAANAANLGDRHNATVVASCVQVAAPHREQLDFGLGVGEDAERKCGGFQNKESVAVASGCAHVVTRR